MSSKRSKKAAGQESPAQAEANQESPKQVESQEVGNGEEQTPATIVESSAEQLFAGQEQPQEAVAEQPEEKTAPKPKVSKRPYIADVEVMLNAGSHTKQEMLAFILEKYPAVSKGGASTFLTDLLNEKYRHWKDRAVVKRADGKLQFAGRVPAATEATEPEAQPTGDTPDKPAE